MMGNVLVHTLMSLDGFIAGPDDNMSWVFRHVGDMPSTVVDEVIARTGAVLAGRNVYDVGRRVQRPDARGLFDGRWKGPHFILTHKPPTDETHPSYIFISGDIGDAVATALTAADGRDVLVLGANVVGQWPRGWARRRDPLAHRAGADRRRGPAVRCPDAPRVPHDPRRVGIRTGREPAVASRRSGR
jgi:dihydrofolate reductase